MRTIIIHVNSCIISLRFMRKEANSIMKNSLSGSLDMNRVTSKRLFFAHQSVGYNILSGVQQVSGRVSIIDISGKKIPASIEPGIWHCAIGRNMDPKGKMTEFKKILIDNGLGAKFDVAALKLCYVDIDRTTDVTDLFKTYAETIDSIEKRYPNLVIIHFTVPLTIHNPRRLRTTIKYYFFGDINVSRNVYNDLIRQKYHGKQPFFNLAEVEAVRPDGKRESFSFKGKKYDALYPGYSSDGGHLNSVGQEKAAMQLLKTIADAESKIGALLQQHPE
jgi:hypothetical protein